MSNSQLKIKTTPLPNSRIGIEIEIPSKECKTSFEDAISNLCKSASLPGFRKGKVPKSVILQQLGPKRIQASALEKLLEKIWKKALKQESIEPLCEPELSGGFEALLKNFNPEKNLLVTLETDISPIPKLKAKKGLNVEVEIESFDESKVDELIEQSRKQIATIVPVENRSAAHGDIAVISFKGKFKDDDSEIERGSSDSMDLELEEGRMIPGFIEGIYGMNINEEKKIDCLFPKDYQDEKARGREAQFNVLLKDLKTRELPKLDDAFAKEASGKSNMKELRIDLSKRLQEDADRRQKKNRQESLLKVLVEQLEVDLPKTLIDQEIRNLIEQMARNFAEQGMDVKATFTPELVESLMKSSKPEAEANLKNQFALNAVAKEENIAIDQKVLDMKIKEVEKELKKEKNIDPKRLRQAVEDDLLRDKIFDWLEANNTVIEKYPSSNSKAKKTNSKKQEMTQKDKKTNSKTDKTSKSSTEK